LESERDTANTELIQARVEVAKAQSERETFTASLNTLEERLQDLGGDVEKAQKAKNQVSGKSSESQELGQWKKLGKPRIR
jgi:uncharacterized protein (DUF3084 family)